MREIIYQSLWIAKYQILETLRQPTYLVTTLAFPPMFFGFFAVPNIKDEFAAQFMMGSFACFAFLGVVMFQFGVAIAQERGSHWYNTIRTVPLRPSAVLLARVWSGIPFALLAVLSVVIAAHLTVKVNLPGDRWVPFLGAVLFAGLPFSCLGLLIGVVASPRSALPLANLIYLPMSFGGGLWLPPNALPESLKVIFENLPTRFYGEIVWAQIGAKAVGERNIWGLLICSILALAAATFFYKRDEGARST
jgi:ABC-2 type transport system permease protein